MSHCKYASHLEFNFILNNKPMSRNALPISLQPQSSSKKHSFPSRRQFHLQNVKLAQSWDLPQSPVNKVLALKKSNIQKIIQNIVGKPHVVDLSHLSKKQRGLAKKTSLQERSYKEIYETHQAEEGLLMDIDEEIGDMIINMEENFAPTSERITSVLAKVGKHLRNKQKDEKEVEVLKYLSFVSTKTQKTLPNPEKQQVKGLVEELEELSKSRVKSSMRKRVQSAKLIGSAAQSDGFFARQSKSRLVQRTTSNLRQKQRLSLQIDKSKQLLTMINACLSQQEKAKTVYQKNMNQMKDEWGRQSKLERTILAASNLMLSSDALGILKEKRLKQSAMARLDNQYLNS